MHICKVKKGRTLFLLCFLILASIGELFANQVDSLENKLVAATGTERLVLLDKLSFDLSRVDSKRAEMLALEGIELAKTLQDSTVLSIINFNLGGILKLQNRLQESREQVIFGLNYFKKKGQKRNIGRGNLLLGSVFMAEGDYSSADSLVSKAVSDLIAAKDTILLVSAYTVKGHINYYKKDYEEANKHYQESLTLAKSSANHKLISPALSNLGMIQRRLINYPEALAYYFQGLELAVDDLGKANILNNISNVYNELEDWASALKYQKEALKIKKKLGFPIQIANSLDNIGVIYKNMLNYGDALNYCHQALDLKEKLEGENKSIENTLNNLGNIYSKISNYEDAFVFYERSLAACLQTNNQKGTGRAYYNIARTKCKIKKYEEALPLALQSLKIAQRRNNLKTRMSRNELLSEIYDALGNHKKSLLHRNVYYSYKDSIYNLNNLRKITELENQQSQQKIVAENEELKKEEQQYFSQIRAYKWLLGMSVLLLSLLVFYYLKQQQKTKTDKRLTAKNLKEQELKSVEKDHMLQERLNQLQEMLLVQSKESTIPITKTEAKIATQNPQKIALKSMSNFLIDNLNTGKDWVAFEHYFTKVHVDFFKELKTDFPNITPNELNLCALIRLNLLNNEIGEVMGINSDSARRAQYRLAKKMNLSNNDALRTFLLKM